MPILLGRLDEFDVAPQLHRGQTSAFPRRLRSLDTANERPELVELGDVWVEDELSVLPVVIDEEPDLMDRPSTLRQYQPRGKRFGLQLDDWPVGSRTG